MQIIGKNHSCKPTRIYSRHTYYERVSIEQFSYLYYKKETLQNTHLFILVATDRISVQGVPRLFLADKPFLYFIKHYKTVLFVGRFVRVFS